MTSVFIRNFDTDTIKYIWRKSDIKIPGSLYTSIKICFGNVVVKWTWVSGFYNCQKMNLLSIQGIKQISSWGNTPSACYTHKGFQIWLESLATYQSLDQHSGTRVCSRHVTSLFNYRICSSIQGGKHSLSE